MDQKPHVVILGAGFGGLYATQALRRAPVRITLVDRRNHHLFQPLLYQVATAALNPSDIAAPIRRVLRHQKNAEVVLAEARAIDVTGKRVLLQDGELAYDYLIVATGVSHSYFGHSAWEQFALGGKHIGARTVLWGAGVVGSSLLRSISAPLDRAGRVLVESDLTIPGYPHVYVISDAAAIQQDGKPVPGVAPAAIQAGRHSARNIMRSICNQPRVPFHYIDKGSLATIGRAAAVADLGALKLSGLIAWLAWLLVHIFFLIGFRNRFLVLFEWAWSYVTYDRGARLITGDMMKPQNCVEKQR